MTELQQIIGSRLLQGKIVLAEHFVHGDCHGVGQIQTAQVFPHGDAHTGVQMFPEEAFRQSGGLLAEHDVHRQRIGNFRVSPGSFCCKIVHSRPRIADKEIVQIFVIGDVQQMPVVKTCTLELSVVDGKAHGLDDMKGRTGSRTGSGDVAGVRGNLRFVENNIQI